MIRWCSTKVDILEIGPKLAKVNVTRKRIFNKQKLLAFVREGR